MSLLLCLYSAADFAELYGSATENGNPNGAKRLGAFANGAFTPLSGAAFGPNRNHVTLTADNRVTNADPNTTGTMFVPASGWRDWNTGAVYYIGSWGQSFSSTASTSAKGHYFEFNSTSIAPQQNDTRLNAFPVRCIRD